MMSSLITAATTVIASATCTPNFRNNISHAHPTYKFNHKTSYPNFNIILKRATVKVGTPAAKTHKMKFIFIFNILKVFFTFSLVDKPLTVLSKVLRYARACSGLLPEVTRSSYMSRAFVKFIYKTPYLNLKKETSFSMLARPSRKASTIICACSSGIPDFFNLIKTSKVLMWHFMNPSFLLIKISHLKLSKEYIDNKIFNTSNRNTNNKGNQKCNITYYFCEFFNHFVISPIIISKRFIKYQNCMPINDNKAAKPHPIKDNFDSILLNLKSMLWNLGSNLTSYSKKAIFKSCFVTKSASPSLTRLESSTILSNASSSDWPFSLKRLNTSNLLNMIKEPYLNLKKETSFSMLARPSRKASTIICACSSGIPDSFNLIKTSKVLIWHFMNPSFLLIKISYYNQPFFLKYIWTIYAINMGSITVKAKSDFISLLSTVNSWVKYSFVTTLSKDLSKTFTCSLASSSEKPAFIRFSYVCKVSIWLMILSPYFFRTIKSFISCISSLKEARSLLKSPTSIVKIAMTFFTLFISIVKTQRTPVIPIATANIKLPTALTVRWLAYSLFISLMYSFKFSQRVSSVFLAVYACCKASLSLEPASKACLYMDKVSKLLISSFMILSPWLYSILSNKECQLCNYNEKGISLCL